MLGTTTGIPYCENIRLTDYGARPFVLNINQVTKQNNTYRTAIWTGKNLQVTLMSINVGDDIGLEVHPTTDQFIRIEEGQGLVQMGDNKDKLDFQEMVYDDYAIMIPAGKWHNVINTGIHHLKFTLFMHLQSIPMVQFMKPKRLPCLLKQIGIINEKLSWS